MNDRWTLKKTIASFGSLLLCGSVLWAQNPPPKQAAAPPASGSAAPATPAAAPPAEGAFTKEQLEQLVAPIALYSDNLLAQILMASTYPIEIVEAERFMTANPTLAGTELETKLKDFDWDPTVKSMCTIPDTLKKMSENLDWTQDLGDAFLGQQAELMDTVQVMRNKAHDSGNLKTNEQQVVKVENTVNVQTTGEAAPASSGGPPGLNDFRAARRASICLSDSATCSSAARCISGSIVVYTRRPLSDRRSQPNCLTSC